MSRFPAMTELSNALLPASGLACLSTHTPRWRPGLAKEGQLANHSEVFATSREASGAAAALALAADALRATERSVSAEAEDRRVLLWVQDRDALRKGGRPYRPGLPPAFRNRVVHVACESPEDALFALEEGLRCREVAAVVGEIAGNPARARFHRLAPADADRRKARRAAVARPARCGTRSFLRTAAVGYGSRPFSAPALEQ